MVLPRILRGPVCELTVLIAQHNRADECRGAPDGGAQGFVIADPVHRRFRVEHIEGDHFRAAARTKIDDRTIHFARPRPGPAVLFLAPIEAGLVQQDDFDFIGGRTGMGKVTHAPCPRRVFPAVEPAGGPEPCGHQRRKEADQQTVDQLFRFNHKKHPSPLCFVIGVGVGIAIGFEMTKESIPTGIPIKITYLLYHSSGSSKLDPYTM